jgi:phosphoribosyl-ATP pyrophosphohydrolase
VERLEADLRLIPGDPQRAPKTARLLAAGVPQQAKKMVEEAAELAIEAVRGDRQAAIREAADLIYNLVVLLNGLQLGTADIWQELDRRRSEFGIAAKLPKRASPTRPRA